MEFNSLSCFCLDVPNPPTDLNTTDISYSTISLKWKPGFDGGWTQSFWISIDNSLWKETNDSHFTFTSQSSPLYKDILNYLFRSSTFGIL
jgi:hypothetical protein